MESASEAPCRAKVLGFMKAALGRCNQLLAHDALRALSRLLRRGQRIPKVEVVKQLIRRALLLQCPEHRVQARS